MTTLDALDLAAAALRDCRNAALKAAEPQYAALLFEAHDRIQHLRECEIKAGGSNARFVPRDTTETQQAPVVAVALTH